jgi:mannose/fructose/N-acetylgalactosamine-specific phosphotransferase system component IID
MSVLGIWIAFLVGWAFNKVQAASYSSHGADLPEPTLLWLDLDSWLALFLPAICTLLIVWLIWRRSVHLNWVAGSLLFFGLFYGAFAQTAAILPAFRMCGSL